LRNFTLGKRIPDDKITGTTGLENIMQLIGVLVPFVSPLFRFQFALASILQRAIPLSGVRPAPQLASMTV
jgi:hypothetical protein